jgi:subtilisin family serine protease
MEKLYILILISQFMFIGLVAQSDYYWHENQKIYLEKIPNKKFVIIDDAINSKIRFKQMFDNDDSINIVNFERDNVLKTINPFESLKATEKNWAVIESSNIADYTLTDNEYILYEAPFYITANGIEVGVSHLFYVRLHDEIDIVKLEQLAKQNKVEILGNNYYMPLWFTLSTSKHSKGIALEMANLFYEEGVFKHSYPDLMTNEPPLCVNDNLFSLQWNLKNTGQRPGSPVGLDINICKTRGITTGKSEVIIAILDHGLEFDHPDLLNIHSISFDTETGTSPSKVWNNHGMPIGGIIGAKTNNTIGVAGIAPDCQLMSISNQLSGPNTLQKRANGIHFAWQNNASVINNSWFTILGPDFILEEAIDIALIRGRNGLGTVIVFAAGNNYEPFVLYPANFHPDILAVRATHLSGTLMGNYGPELDIVAPGAVIPSTDRQAPNGYDPNADYILDFGGSSAAAPHVAGVAGLILSVNPCLTALEVNNIIERTARKVVFKPPFDYYQPTPGRPNGDWNENAGYGLLDAYEAVKMAGTRNLNNTTLTGNMIHSAGYGFNVTNTNIGSSSHITLKARIEGNIESLVVPLGSSFEFIIDPNSVNDCAPIFEYSLNVNWVQMGPTGQLQFSYSIKNVSNSTKTFYLKGTANNDSMSTSTESHTLSAGHGAGGMLPISASTQPSNWKFYIREGDSNFSRYDVVASEL